MGGFIFSFILTLLYPFATYAIHFYEVDLSKSLIKIKGDSSLHKWELEAKEMSGVATLEESRGTQRSIKDIEIKVLVKKLESDSEGLTKKAHELLKAKSHPYITFDMNKVIESTHKRESYQAVVSGDLQVGGRKKTVTVTGYYDLFENSLRVYGNHNLKMTDFGLDPPAMLMLKTEDQITIIFDLFLKNRSR